MTDNSAMKWVRARLRDARRDSEVHPEGHTLRSFYEAQAIAYENVLSLLEHEKPATPRTDSDERTAGLSWLRLTPEQKPIKSFPNRAGQSDADDAIAFELEDAGIEVHRLELLRKTSGEVKTAVRGELHGWSFTRAWRYWIAEGPGIELAAANALYAAHPETVRVDGHCGCPSPSEWFKGLAVGTYHVDSQAGLKGIADTIRALVERPDTPAPSSPGVPDSVRALEAERDELWRENLALRGADRASAANAICDSYARENQRLFDRATQMQAERDALISTHPAGQSTGQGADDRTDEWRRGMLEAADLCRSYAATARGPSPFDDEATAGHRALAYETAAEAIEGRMAEGQKLRAESCFADKGGISSSDLGWNRKLAAWLVWFAEQQFAGTHDYSARNRLRWASEALIGADGVADLAKPAPDSTRTGQVGTVGEIAHAAYYGHTPQSLRAGWLVLPQKVRDSWERAAAALAARPAATEAQVAWQDISTAPPNKAVQVYVPNHDYYGNEGVYAGMLVDMGTGQRWMTFAWAMGRDMCGDSRPTHWRPLPAPPSSGQEG